MEIYKYEDNRFYQPKKFPIISTRAKNAFNEAINIMPIINPIVKDEIFVWVVHSAITPNVIPYRYLISNYGRLWDCSIGGIKEAHNSDSGYKVKLFQYIRDNETRYFDVAIHRLVAFYFLYFPHCENYQVIHNNGNKYDNRVCNLSWLVPKKEQDELSKYNISTNNPYIIDKIYTNNYNMNIPREVIENICKRIIIGESNEEIASIFGFTPEYISLIRHGNLYNDILSRCYREMYPNRVIEEKKTIPTKKLTPEQVHKVCQLLMDENIKTKQEVCEKGNCTERQIRSIVSDKAYYDISKIYRLEEMPKRK